MPQTQGHPPTFVKEPELKSHGDPQTLRVGESNTLLSPMDRSPRQKLNREIMKQTDILNRMKLTDIFRAFRPK